MLCIVLLTACSNTSQVDANQTGGSTRQFVAAQITLSDFHIISSVMLFTPGALYHFTVTNTGKTAHELMLLSSTMKTMDMSGMPMRLMDTMALAHREQINPGETTTLDYTFALQGAGVHPEFSCRLPGHYAAGMHLDVTVRSQQS